MHLFNIDAHISVIADIQQQLALLGHTVQSVNVSDHMFVFRQEPVNIPYLRHGQWQTLDMGGVIDTFTSEYRAQIEKCDAVITTYAPLFAMLFARFKKPQIVVCPIRFDYGVHRDPIRMRKLIEYLQQEHIILVANSLYDKLYTENWVNREVHLIPSICDYTGSKYTSTRPDILYYSDAKINLPPNFRWKQENLTAGGHKWSDVFSYKGIVHFPYQVSTMSMFEQVTANVPLFIPTQRLLLELYTKGLTLRQYSNQRMDGYTSQSVIAGKNAYDPNDYRNISAVQHWIQHADYYQPTWQRFIHYFDTIPELIWKVDNINYNDTSDIMSEINITERQPEVQQRWTKVMQLVDNLTQTRTQ